MVGPRGFPRPRAAGRTACCAATATGSGGSRACPVPRCLVGLPKRSRLRCRRGRTGSTGMPPIAKHIARVCWPASRPSAPGRSTRRASVRSSPARSPAKPLDFFIDGVARTAPARAAYVAGPWGAVASLSPELFLCRRGDLVTSSPIKGTLPLYAPPSALRESSKDVAENVMIVDLVRNDLGRVAVTGSVTVPELLVVRPAPGVWHLVSTVSAQVPSRCRPRRCSTRPSRPPRLPERPKIRARQLISQWEQYSRGVYCGTIGLASPVAGCELNVAIRTVEFDAVGNALLGSGGGITADSDADAEWEECLHKAAPIIGAGAASAARSQHRVVELTP